MNEKIKELAEQAEEYADQFVYVQAIGMPGHKEKFNEKFAELIVKECCRSLWTEECHTSDLAVEDFNRNIKKIKQHFGIKE